LSTNLGMGPPQGLVTRTESGPSQESLNLDWFRNTDSFWIFLVSRTLDLLSNTNLVMGPQQGLVPPPRICTFSGKPKSGLVVHRGAALAQRLSGSGGRYIVPQPPNGRNSATIRPFLQARRDASKDKRPGKGRPPGTNLRLGAAHKFPQGAVSRFSRFLRGLNRRASRWGTATAPSKPQERNLEIALFERAKVRSSVQVRVSEQLRAGRVGPTTESSRLPHRIFAPYCARGPSLALGRPCMTRLEPWPFSARGLPRPQRQREHTR
jgi:hypothetical protein